MMNKKSIFTYAAAGAVAGLVSGLVKLGWEALLPPRTPERDETNPPQEYLQQHGLSYDQTHATYRYNGHDIPWVSLLMHFTFSSSLGAAYAVAGHYLPIVKMGQGTMFGLATWAGAHLVALPMQGTIPSAKDQPMEEHASEALGHMVWNWTNNEMTDVLVHQWTKNHD